MQSVSDPKRMLGTHSHGSGLPSFHSKREAQPRTGRDKLVSLLADLLGYSRRTEGPKPHSYEPMGPAFGAKPKCVAVLYERCARCKEERCPPPPRPPPPVILPNRSASGPSVSGRGASQEPVSANHQSRGSQAGEVRGSTPSPEDKRKEEHRRAEYEIMEGRALERNAEGEEKSKYELMGSCGHQRILQEAEGSVFVFPPEPVGSDRLRSEVVTYVNIPISPTSKKQLNYMELELQETGPGPRGTTQHLPGQRKCSTKYAQIDITATEMAHKVGTQHALGRQEGLLTLELRRKATPH